jgi:hypothetical protein
MMTPSRPGELGLSPCNPDTPRFAFNLMMTDGSRLRIFQTPAQLDKGVRLMVRCSQLFSWGESTQGTSSSGRRVFLHNDQDRSLRFPRKRYGKKSGNFSFNLTGVDEISKINSNPCLGGVNRFSGMSSRVISNVSVNQAGGGCYCASSKPLRFYSFGREPIGTITVLLKEVCK